MKINWKRALGYGVLFYIIIYVATTAFVAYKINPQTDIVAWSIMMAITLTTGYFISLRLEMKDYKEALMYGIVWVIITVLLDLVLTVPFTGISFIENWRFFTGIAVTLLIPVGSLFLSGLLNNKTNMEGK